MGAQQNIVGREIKRLRKAKGLTQDNVAARCAKLGWNTTENVITKIESQIRCVTDRELIILASALKVPLKELFPKYPRLF